MVFRRHSSTRPASELQVVDLYRPNPADTEGENTGDGKLQRENQHLVLIIIKSKHLIGVYFLAEIGKATYVQPGFVSSSKQGKGKKGKRETSAVW